MNVVQMDDIGPNVVDLLQKGAGRTSGCQAMVVEQSGFDSVFQAIPPGRYPDQARCGGIGESSVCDPRFVSGIHGCFPDAFRNAAGRSAVSRHVYLKDFHANVISDRCFFALPCQRMCGPSIQAHPAVNSPCGEMFE